MPDMPASKVEELINTKDPFLFTPQRDHLFFEAMKECFLHHYDNCPTFRKICYLDGLTPEHFLSYRDIFHIPHLFVSVLKQRQIQSVPEEQVKMTLHSSGTTGQRSAIPIDDVTESRIRRIVWNIYQSYGMADNTLTVNAILFSYQYDQARDIGTAFSDILLSGLTQVRESVFALKHDARKNDFYLDRDGIIEALIRFEREGLPLRIIGFPAYLYEIMQEYQKRKLPPLKFSKKSFIIIGGGWKDKAEQEIPKERFGELMSLWLGIPRRNIRDLFGMVEHGVPYCECEEGNLHVPIYSRAVVRDLDTMQILPDGHRGLLHLYTPYLHSFPAISLLTTDLAVTGAHCPCGRNAPYIEILGRGGVVKHKGCAINALEYLKLAETGETGETGETE